MTWLFSKNVILEYMLKLSENMLSDTFGDIVVAHSGEGKLDVGNGGQVGGYLGGKTVAQDGDVNGTITHTIALMTIILSIIFL